MTDTINNSEYTNRSVIEKRLTTRDNPFDPFTQASEWERFDKDHGYYTTSALFRIACTSPELTTLENIKEINAAVEEIVQLDFLGIYKVVTRIVKESEYIDS